MKKKYMFYVLNFLCLLLMNAPNVYATSGHLIDHNKENLSSMFINEITMNLTPTAQTCTGNGKINVSIGNTEPGAQFIIQVYQLPNETVPVQIYDNLIATSNTLSMVAENLPNGNFRVVAIQTVGTEENTKSAETTIANNVQNPNINYQLTYSCGNVADVTVTYSSGNIVSYQLNTTGANPTIVRDWQSSNVFEDVPNGSYVIYAKDICDKVQSTGFTVDELNVSYNMTIIPTSYTCYNFMSSYNTIFHNGPSILSCFTPYKPSVIYVI